MKDLTIPTGHRRVNPYFLVQDPDAFMAFLRNALGATERDVHRDKDGIVRHAELAIGDSAVMLGQATEQWKAASSMNYLYVADTDATHRACMAAGCTELYAPKDEVYGVRGSGVRDPWGNTWWLAQPLAGR